MWTWILPKCLVSFYTQLEFYVTLTTQQTSCEKWLNRRFFALDRLLADGIIKSEWRQAFEELLIFIQLPWTASLLLLLMRTCLFVKNVNKQPVVWSEASKQEKAMEKSLQGFNFLILHGQLFHRRCPLSNVCIRRFLIFSPRWLNENKRVESFGESKHSLFIFVFNFISERLIFNFFSCRYETFDELSGF